MLTSTHGRAKGPVLLFMMLFFSSTPASAIQLTDVEWKKRPLLLFAPQHDSVRLQQTQHRLHQNSCKLDDRDMIIAVIVGQGNSSIDQQAITLEYASTLRKQFGLSSDQFAVLLLGKDGGEKYRSYRLPDLDQIFALIDGMPMRQNEMYDNHVDCSK
jgi:hypothetical protein